MINEQITRPLFHQSAGASISFFSNQFPLAVSQVTPSLSSARCPGVFHLKPAEQHLSAPEFTAEITVISGKCQISGVQMPTEPFPESDLLRLLLTPLPRRYQSPGDH